MGEPGTLYAAQAGVASIDHATQLSDQTVRLMKEKGIFAVPTFAIFEYFAKHRESQDQAAAEAEMLNYKIAEFKKQIERCRQQNNKLFTSPAGEDVVLAHCTAELTGDGAESGVARLVPMAVIDLLEVIHIDKHERDGLGSARGP